MENKTVIENMNVVLIEDNMFVRKGWEAVLSAEKNIKVLGSFGSCEDAFKTYIFKYADIVLMDIGLPGINGIEGVKYLTKEYPGLLIIMCTVHDENENVFDAICSGAVGYLLKKTSPSELIEALHEAYLGGSPMTPSIARKIILSFQQKPDKENNLTQRELEILTLMSEGLTYKEIAGKIFLSVDGVYYHIRNIYEKLHVHSRTEAVTKGLRQRIINPPRK